MSKYTAGTSWWLANVTVAPVSAWQRVSRQPWCRAQHGGHTAETLVQVHMVPRCWLGLAGAGRRNKVKCSRVISNLLLHNRAARRSAAAVTHLSRDWFHHPPAQPSPAQPSPAAGCTHSTITEGWRSGPLSPTKVNIYRCWAACDPQPSSCCYLLMMKYFCFISP